jgi:hypothetical protein
MIKWIQALILSICAIFMPIAPVLGTTLAMILIDLITGVLAAKKQSLPITSAGLRRTLSKLFVYELALMLAFLVETYMSQYIPFVKMASSMIALVELTSVYENLNVIGGNNLLKGLIDKLGSESHK